MRRLLALGVLAATVTALGPAVAPVSSAQAVASCVNPAKGKITGTYGFRTHPVTGTRQFHDGTDISNDAGTLVVAPKYGRVSVIRNQEWAGPNYVVIDHGNGLKTTYAHMRKALVVDGERVGAGDPIGRIGALGYVTAPLLHMTVSVNGRTVNPQPWFRNNCGVVLGR